jgi:lipopolysaccharide biosynthesis regulator YciM
MNNVVGLILSAALIADTVANLLRSRGVERAIRQQEDMMRRSELEAGKRTDAAAEAIESVVKATVLELIEKSKE